MPFNTHTYGAAYHQKDAGIVTILVKQDFGGSKMLSCSCLSQAGLQVFARVQDQALSILTHDAGVYDIFRAIVQ